MNGCFILGLDGQGATVFDEVLDFVRCVNPFDVQVTVLTAFPGTPLYRRLADAGRILVPGAWHLCTLFDVNFQPAQMSPQELREGIYRLAGELYADDETRRRRKAFFGQCEALAVG